MKQKNLKIKKSLLQKKIQKINLEQKKKIKKNSKLFQILKNFEGKKSKVYG